MNWQQLEYFNTISKTENFTEAATLLNVTQPALSKAISKLEEELEVPLFEKQGRNIKLTRYGMAFLKHTKLALNEVSEGIRELKDMKNPNTGTVSISSLYTIGTRLIPEAVSEFLNEYPDIKFEYGMETTDTILKSLSEGQLDLGLFADIEDLTMHSDIESIPLKKEKLVGIVPKTHPLSGRTEISLLDLKDDNFIFFSEKIKSKVTSFYHTFGVTPKSNLKPNDNSMVVTGFVSAGLGVSIVPYSACLSRQDLSIVYLRETQCFRTLYMGWKKNAKLSSSAILFKDFLIEFVSRPDPGSLTD